MYILVYQNAQQTIWPHNFSKASQLCIYTHAHKKYSLSTRPSARSEQTNTQRLPHNSRYILIPPPHPFSALSPRQQTLPHIEARKPQMTCDEQQHEQHRSSAEIRQCDHFNPTLGVSKVDSAFFLNPPTTYPPVQHEQSYLEELP